MTEIETMSAQGQGEGAADERVERIAVIDYKMVTFSLAGKDYAIDIMQVKEIAKAGRFTYVPNTSPFVLGVYNLRGEIIPIIDLRIFFNIQTKARERDAVENLIIVSVDDQTFGIVVDVIDKVVGISRGSIQPPHPLFGDINIKYIHGVVENQGRLYILLDVERIFSSRAKEAEEAEVRAIEETLVTEQKPVEAQSKAELGLSFVGDALAALAKFYVTAINERWVADRFREWRDARRGKDAQLTNEAEAREFLSSFYSPFTGALWSDAYAKAVMSHLPDNNAKQINVWDVGCGKGHEAYSLAVVLRERYPNARVRVYANDSDLLAISNAPMLNVAEDQVTPFYKPYLVKGTGGAFSFSQQIKDTILFEYHDCTNQNAVPNMDLIVCRDTLSFLNAKQQTAVIACFTERLKDNGVVVLGANEAMPQRSGWLRHVEADVVSFSKE